MAGICFPAPKGSYRSFVLLPNAVEAAAPKLPLFTRYQIFLIAVLAFLQFTVILDFMVMSPLSAILMPELHISPEEFSHAVSAYSLAAGTAGLLAAGFADRFDRRKMLRVFYIGFIIGTLFCGLAPTYPTLLAARFLTGIFGGVIGSISMAIITDTFLPHVRGRVMGFVQMAFAVSQVAGIPIGVFLATHYNWHAPFLMIVGLSAAAGLVIFRYMRPVTDHIHLQRDANPAKHLWNTFTNKRHSVAFLAMVILSTGGFLMMPFSAAFMVNNAGVPEGKLPWVFMIVGVCSLFTFPLVGRLSDRIGRLTVFTVGTAIAMTTTIIYSRLGLSPLWLVITINAVSFVGISSRIVSSQALMSVVPTPADRGAFMSISSAVQHFSGSSGAWIAGLIVLQPNGTGPLFHYDTLGLICAGTMITCVALLFIVDRQVEHRAGAPPQVSPA